MNKTISLFRKKLLFWFEINGRHYLPWRETGLNTYKITIAEVLLQRTQAATIEKFFARFLNIYPDWQTIACTNINELEETLKPIGLYRQRAKRLKELAIEMVKREGQFPKSRKELEQIPLLGQYIVNAIELQIFNKKRPLLDVNMARVLERYFGERKLADIRYDPYLQALSAKVVNHPKSKEISWAILDFASIICKARKPLCTICPLSSSCIYYNSFVR